MGLPCDLPLFLRRNAGFERYLIAMDIPVILFYQFAVFYGIIESA